MDSIKIIIFLWQLGVVDSLTLFQFFINFGAQYTGLTLGEAAGYMGDIGPSVLLAPVQRLGTSYQYVRAAQGAMEKRARIATVAAFMSMSGRAMLTDPATNAAAGGTIASFIGHDPKSKYRKAQATKFLKQFYNKSYILENVSDEVFCGFWKNWKKKYIDDYCRIEKDIVKMRLAKELLQYKYPFKFP